MKASSGPCGHKIAHSAMRAGEKRPVLHSMASYWLAKVCGWGGYSTRPRKVKGRCANATRKPVLESCQSVTKTDAGAFYFPRAPATRASSSSITRVKASSG